MPCSLSRQFCGLILSIAVLSSCVNSFVIVKNIVSQKSKEKAAANLKRVEDNGDKIQKYAKQPILLEKNI